MSHIDWMSGMSLKSPKNSRHSSLAHSEFMYGGVSEEFVELSSVRRPAALPFLGAIELRISCRPVIEWAASAVNSMPRPACHALKV